jgi:salicylate hydroxylase
VLPFLAQGAALAIEDAVAVAQSLKIHADDPAAAFAHYEVAQQSRAARVQSEAQHFGRLYHLRGALRLARNLMLRARPRQTALDRLDWLYAQSAAPQRQ